jgi:trehalose 6-phosphate phosphatase
VHGLQRRTATGKLELATAHPGLIGAVDLMTAFCADQVGLSLEHKPQSVALHYRRTPSAEPAILEFADWLAEHSGLVVQKGERVVELRTPGPDKGAAVRAFMTEAPFLGATPVYIGDDWTDEAGFKAVAERGGLGILVGRRRATAARAGLRDTADVAVWLSDGLAHGAFDLKSLQWVA